MQVRPGQGTVRTAAVGRAVKALEDLAAGAAGGFGGGLIYVVTDLDADVVPEGPIRSYHDAAVELQASGRLQRVGQVVEQNLILQVWKLGPGEKAVARAADPVAVITRLRSLLPGLIPHTPPTPQPVIQDFEQGRLELAPTGEWTVTGDEASLPVELRTAFQVLSFRGGVNLTSHVDGLPEGVTATVTLTLAPDPVTLSPGDAPAAGRLTVAGLPRARLGQRSALEPQLTVDEVGVTGVLTSEKGLFEVGDPAAMARVSGALWLEEQTVPCQFDAAGVPGLPAVKPPRGAQIGLGLVGVALLFGLLRLGAAARPKPVTLYYRSHRLPGADQTVSLDKLGLPQSFGVSDVRPQVERPGRESRLLITAPAGGQLLDAAGQVVGEVTLQGHEQVGFVVRTGSGQEVSFCGALEPGVLSDPPAPVGQEPTGFREGSDAAPGPDEFEPAEPAGSDDEWISDDQL